MLQHKAFKYRLYPTDEQDVLLRKTLGCCRFVFNHFLTKWKESLERYGKGLSYNKCATQLPELKQAYPWLTQVDSISLQSSVRNLTDGFERFNRKQNEAPRFKSRKHPVQSYTTSVCGQVSPEVKELSVREWKCSNCHTKHDRDENAAHNIRIMAI